MKVNLKDKLVNNQFTIGSWITIGHPSIAEIMVNAGFDWLTIDMEHSAITLHQAQNIIQIIELSGIVSLVRVGENDPTFIKRVMDAGAHGVIVPMVNCKDDAINAVNAVKYPPIGTRGVGLTRAQGYGLEFEKYREWVKRESIVIVQIEHIEAVNNLEEILDVDGVDGSIIGPYDLSGSLGYPGEFDRQEVKQALLRYEDICKKMNKPMGFHVVQPDSEIATSYKGKGYVFLAVGIDMLYLGVKSRDVIKQILP